MRYHGRVNYVKCAEWGLSNDQGSLFDLLNEASSWAKTHIIDNEVYYWVSRNKVLDELPVVYKKADTVYRHLKVLQEKSLIIYRKEGVKDLVMLTEKGKTWNSRINSDLNPSKGDDSDLNPSKLGFESENMPENTDLNPTDKDTNINKDTINKNTTGVTKNKALNIPFDDFWNLYDYKSTNKKTAQSKWSKLSSGDRQSVIEHLPAYIQSTPDKKYRKHPTTYLNQEHWKTPIEPQQTNYQGNTHANGQSVNHSNQQQSSQQFDTSTSSGYAAKLDADAAAYFASIDTQRAVNPSYQEFVSEVEGVVQREDENTW